MRAPPPNLRDHVFDALCQDLREGHTKRTEALREISRQTRR